MPSFVTIGQFTRGLHHPTPVPPRVNPRLTGEGV